MKPQKLLLPKKIENLVRAWPMLYFDINGNDDEICIATSVISLLILTLFMPTNEIT